MSKTEIVLIIVFVTLAVMLGFVIGMAVPRPVTDSYRAGYAQGQLDGANGRWMTVELFKEAVDAGRPNW